MNPFVEGYRQSKADQRAVKAADLDLRQGEQDLTAAQYELSQRNVKDTRQTEAYNYLSGKYGASAGDPTAAGQLAGIEQRGTTFENQQTDRTEDRERAAHLAALNVVEKRVKAGEDPAAVLSSLPPAYRTAAGITDEVAAQMAATIASDPSALDSLRAGLEGRPTNPEFETGVDPTTKKPVFFTRDPGTNQPQIVEGVVPTAKAAGGGSASSSRFVSVAPGITFDKMLGQYGDADGNQISAEDATRAIAAAGRTEKYAVTTGSEEAKIDVAAPDKLKAVAVMRDDLTDMRSLLERGRAAGAFVDTEGGAVQNTAAQVAATRAGAAAARVTEPDKQAIRDELQTIVPRVANKIMQASEMGVKMLDTEKEYERFIAQINQPGTSVQVMLSSLDRLERAMERDEKLVQEQLARSSGGGAKKAVPWNAYFTGEE